MWRRRSPSPALALSGQEGPSLLHPIPWLPIVASLALGAGCIGEGAPDGDDDEDTSPPATDCPPLEGTRFRDEGFQRGLRVGMHDPASAGQDIEGGRGNVVLQDFDGDGDLDILLNETEEGLALFANDGAGQFQLHARLLGFDARPALAVGAADLDEDGLPDLVLGGFGWAGIATNQGGLTFAPPELFLEDHSGAFFGAVSIGDVDGDGDLDLLLPAQVELKVNAGSIEHRLFLLQDGRPTESRALVPAGAPFDSQVGLLADVDGDSDLDVLLLGDQGPTSAIFRNDGPGADGFPTLVDETVSLGFDLDVAAMGLDGADLNGDGRLDWCVTDLGPPKCWVSNGDTFVESSLALGLVPDEWVEPDGTTGWSNDFADLDNDGFVDQVQATAPYDDALSYPDLAWRGGPSGLFDDVGAAWGIDSRDNHFGLATGDLDGDGYLDLVTAGSATRPLLLMNTCSEGGWLEVAAPGPPGNPDGFGAVVEVESGERTWRRPITGPRGQGQGPARAHFGLGDQADGVTVRVRWPDGQEVVVTDVPPRTRPLIPHPSR